MEDGVGVSGNNVGVGVTSQHLSLGIDTFAGKPTAPVSLGSHVDVLVRGYMFYIVLLNRSDV